MEKLNHGLGMVENICSLSHDVFYPVSKREIILLAAFNLLSARALKLIKSKILLFGKELIST